LIADLQRQQAPNEFTSKPEHSLKSGIHFLFFNELSPRDPIDPHLNLFLKPFIVGEQTRNRLLHQLIGGPS
jgi:hypothetical protein